jgi:hypothetical protein
VLKDQARKKAKIDERGPAKAKTRDYVGADVEHRLRGVEVGASKLFRLSQYGYQTKPIHRADERANPLNSTKMVSLRKRYACWQLANRSDCFRSPALPGGAKQHSRHLPPRSLQGFCSLDSTFKRKS